MEDRAEQIESLLSSVSQSWPKVAAEIDERITGLTEQLIAADCQETRGRIKALKDLKDLPVALSHELQAIKAELTT